MKYFNSLKEFFQEKEKCAFCQTLMKPSLSVFKGIEYEQSPFLDVDCQENKFSFHITYENKEHHIDSYCVLDMETSKLIASDDVLIALKSIIMRLELTCDCNYDFAIVSSCLFFDENKKTLPIFSYMENFTINDYWVSNRQLAKETEIYHANSGELIYKTDLMDFRSMSKNILRNKIASLVLL